VGISANLTDLAKEFFVEDEEVRVRMDFACLEWTLDEDEEAVATEGMEDTDGPRGRVSWLNDLEWPSIGTLLSAFDLGRMMAGQAASSTADLSTGLTRRYIHSGW
jgi:hypothetical protein